MTAYPFEPYDNPDTGPASWCPDCRRMIIRTDGHDCEPHGCWFHPTPRLWDCGSCRDAATP